ncbi:MAG TPA: phospholipase D-like domain-containing protein [Vicinamibacterales bacterium]|nr:phospholipase D-like domain-containing protein [Vicinamibacterales bacterium]
MPSLGRDTSVDRGARAAEPAARGTRPLQRRLPHRWRYRLAPDPLFRRPKGALPFWARVRRLFWAWWPWTIACIWALVVDKWGWAIGTGTMAFVSYVISPEETPPRYGLDHEFAVDDADFVASMAGATGVPFAPGNRLDILNNGDAFYPAMLDAIAAAESSITIEAYIYWAGEIGQEFAEALAAKAAAGVHVKILLDAVGSATIGEAILKTLESGGCQLAWYNPVRVRTIGRFNHRTHRKSLIVDGRVAFTGGAGIADQWRGDARTPAEWRDLQIRIEGPAVTPLQTGFAQNWLQTTGELISGPLYYPPHEPAGRLALQTIMSSPEIGASTVRIMYYLSIICARRSIYIANPYFVPDAAAIETLSEARRRGVDVRVMVSGLHNDNWLARQNSIRLYGPLLRAGVVILEFDRTMLHHKTMVVDARWATVGTTNFDNRSFAHNEENNVCCYDEAIARQLHDTFEQDIESCQRVTLEAWNRRGVVRRASGIAASFLQDQI